MCTNMKELQTISEKIFDLEQKKAKKKKEMDALEKEIKQLKSETSSYMKKRQKNSAQWVLIFRLKMRNVFAAAQFWDVLILHVQWLKKG